jgi:Protein of unknown function (DUF1593).
MRRANKIPAISQIKPTRLNIRCTSVLALTVFLVSNASQANDSKPAGIINEKPRLFVLTDIGGDPDDQMSMVRLMTYANQLDIEGLVATPTGHEKSELNLNVSNVSLKPMERCRTTYFSTNRDTPRRNHYSM